jgi:hexosaminidase
MTRNNSRSRPAVWVLLAGGLLAWIAGAVAATPDAGLALRWRIESNAYPPAVQAPRSSGSLTIRAEGALALGSGGWSLWFTSAGPIRTGDLDGHLRIEGHNGSLYRLAPTTGFAGIPPGAELVVQIPYSAIVVKDTEAPLGPYLVLDGTPDIGRGIRRYLIEPRVRPEQLPRDAPGEPSVVTADALYARNAGIADLPIDALPPVFPTPVEARRRDGLLHWSHRPRVEAGSGLAAEASLAARILKRALPASAETGHEPPLRLAIGPVLPAGNPEAYILDVDARDGVTVTGNSAAGVSRGLQSLSALLPATAGPGVDLPAWLIHDAPRFAYRGLALDLARNFQPMPVVLRYLDLLARYKLNVLHMHLTDDEGWRLEIAGLPELTTVGARRGHSSDELRHLPPAHGSGADADDPHGSGYLSRQDFEAILRHAASLHIEVIPEIEMPGHARAAVKAMQGRARSLGHAGDSGAMQFRLDEPDDQSEYESAQSFTDNVMNPGLESTYAFIDHVLGDVAAMYREAGVPLHTIHVGGDELPTGAWTKSPACEALKRRHHLAETADVWDYFYGRVDRLLKARGLRASGWEEIGSRRVKMHGVPKLIPNPQFVNAGVTTYVWNNLDGAADLGVRLANAGYRTVLAPVTAFYFDMAYNRNPEEPGGKWAPFIDLEDAYDFVPYDFVRAHATDPTPVAGRDGLADFGRANIAGLEGQLWAESLRDLERIDYMLMPRLLGLAERAWATDPEWAQAPDPATADRLHARAWSVFVNQLGKQVLPRLDDEHAGIAYRIPPPGLRVEGGAVRANLQLPGLVLRFTSDGTDPTPASREVAGPIVERGSVRVAAFDRNGRIGRISQIENR